MEKNSLYFLYGKSNLQIPSGAVPWIRKHRGIGYPFAPEIIWIDMFGFTKSPIRFTSHKQLYDPSYKFKNINANMHDLILEKAKKVLERSRKENKQIAVYYSGGIDSSLLLAAFLHVGDMKELRDQLVIYMNYTSIQENFEFYIKFIRPNLRLVDVNTNLAVPYSGSDKWLIVSGGGADILFGSDLLDWFIEQDIKVDTEPMTYKWFYKWWTATSEKVANQAEWYYNFLQDHHIQFEQRTGKQIKTIFEWIWYLSTAFLGTSATIRSIPARLIKNEVAGSTNEIANVFDNNIFFWYDMELQNCSVYNIIPYNATDGLYTKKHQLEMYSQMTGLKYKKQSMGSLYKVFEFRPIAPAMDSNMQIVNDLTPYYENDHSFKTLPA